MPKIAAHWFRFCGVIAQDGKYAPAIELRARFVCARCGVERWHKYKLSEMITSDGQSAKFKRRDLHADECGTKCEIEPVTAK
jgi:hypothetical protein